MALGPFWLPSVHFEENNNTWHSWEVYFAPSLAGPCELSPPTKLAMLLLTAEQSNQISRSNTFGAWELGNHY